jgi:hypothetical protein
MRNSAHLVGLMVLASWASLLVGGRWRARRIWVDRLGRLVSSLWIILALARELARYLDVMVYVW